MTKKKSIRNYNVTNKRVNLSIVKNIIQNKYYGGAQSNGFRIPPTLSQTLEFKRMKLSSILNMTNDLPQIIRGHCKLSKPSKIIEVVFSKEILFVLNDSGLGTAYNRHNNKVLCILNRSPSETIRSLFYNKMNNTIVIAFHHDPSVLNCTIFNIEDVMLKRNISSSIGKEFQQIKVGNPGFIEFDDGNGRIVVADPQNDYFTFWDMSNYNKLYQIKGQNFLEMRISDGTVVFFRQPSYSTIEAHLCNISDGEYLEKTIVKLRSSLDIQFLELHREYLLLKQESCSIRVWNLLTNSSKKISKTRDFHPKAFIFFDQITEINNFTNFLTVSTDEINVWTCNNFGEVEVKFRISLPGIQTADCVNVCFSKGIIMTYCNGLLINEFRQENEDTNNMLHLNEENNNNQNSSYMSVFIPQFIQASKYFSNLCGPNNNNNENSSLVISSNSISLSATITGETISESEQEITGNNYISINHTSSSCQNQNQISTFELNTSCLNQQDGLLAPFCPLIDDEIAICSKNKSSLRKAIYIHSLYDGSSLGTIFCDDINDDSEDVVLLHYDSDGMEIACGTNYGLLRRYKHIFG
ncbi:putative low complexity [Cryptosporidium sp. chipmunk genotype I]|uniref:putative low complexity n=1 Tax=Cryptosporidium sp. chipmunk genotype I TaxID=1280935 RepID=UPI003519DBD1|nr:putative low complexity [Cryptosporidium sp. chipmunk genotype I]